MRQIPFPAPATLRPGDIASINFELQLHNNIAQKVTLVAVRWEPVWGTELSAAEREQLESTAVLLTPPSTTPVGIWS